MQIFTTFQGKETWERKKELAIKKKKDGKLNETNTL